jgi:G:T-mismatch repair DNA endonuclease (very short patch repair protein)
VRYNTRGLRFYVGHRQVIGTPDLAILSRRVAVFVRGDF